MALLLGGVIVVALIGQLSAHSSSTSSKAPHAAAKAGKHTPVAAPPSTAPPEPAAAGTLLVFIEPPPSDAPNGDAGLAAAHRAIQDWSQEGRDLAETDSAGEADLTLYYELDWQGRYGGADTGIVGLGDTKCDGAWTPFTQASLDALATHALGRAMGEPGSLEPGSLMDSRFEPEHEGACQAGHGTVQIELGASQGKPFRLSGPMTVSYTMEEQTGGYVDVCILDPTEWDSFVAGEASGESCRYSTSSDSASAALEAGDYILGFRCVDESAGCEVAYTLASQP